MRWSSFLVLVASLQACGPDLNRADRSFDERLFNALAERQIGPVPTSESQRALSELFDEDLSYVCLVYGGDWTSGVDYQWSHAETPPPIGVDALRNLGSGQMDYDGMAAVIGVGTDGLGHVRRGWFGDGACSDYSGGPQCLPIENIALEITEGEIRDGGLFEGRRPKQLILIDTSTNQRSCPLEPDLR